MNEDIRAKLAAPMDYKFRPGSTSKKRENGKYPPGTKAMMLAFVDARDIMDRLDDVVGVGNWQSDLKQVNPDGSVMVALSIRMPHTTSSIPADGSAFLNVNASHEWVTHVDCGYKNAPDNDSESEPLKAAMSDGLKRAAVRFGVGRFLYDLPSHWAEIDEWGKPLKGSNDSTGVAMSQPAQRRDDLVQAKAADDSFASRQSTPSLMQQAKGAPITAPVLSGSKPCQVPGCTLICDEKFVGYSQRTYGLVLCGKHSKKAKDGELDIEAVKEDIRNGTVTREVALSGAMGTDPLSQDHARIEAEKNGAEIIGWTEFYSKWRPRKVTNLQDVERITKIKGDALAGMTPQAVNDALVEAGA